MLTTHFHWGVYCRLVSRSALPSSGTAAHCTQCLQEHITSLYTASGPCVALHVMRVAPGHMGGWGEHLAVCGRVIRNLRKTCAGLVWWSVELYCQESDKIPASPSTVGFVWVWCFFVSTKSESIHLRGPQLLSLKKMYYIHRNIKR